MGAERATRTRVYLLRMEREVDGSLRLTLRARGVHQALHFSSMEALTAHLRGLEAEFRPRGLR